MPLPWRLTALPKMRTSEAPDDRRMPYPAPFAARDGEVIVLPSMLITEPPTSHTPCTPGSLMLLPMILSRVQLFALTPDPFGA